MEELVVDTVDACPGVVEWAAGGGGRLLEITTVLDAGETVVSFLLGWGEKSPPAKKSDKLI